MKTELHLHTSETSRCGKVGAKELVRAYYEAGYGCLVVTDHFSPYFIDRCKYFLPEDLKDAYLKGYRAAREEGERLGITVLLGAEICLEESNNDYLVYGVDEEMFSTPEICSMKPDELAELCKSKGALLYQAHPFRNKMKIIDPGLLFGIEVYNGNPRHNSRNEIANAWAELHGMRKISGSDYHQTPDLARGGIISNRDIRDNADLLWVLQNGEYTLITTD